MMRAVFCLSSLTYWGYRSERLVLGTAIGCFAFLLMYLGDLNDWKFGIPVLRFLFPAGFALLSCSSLLLFGTGRSELPETGKWIFAALALLSLVLLLISLFFSFSAEEAYVTQQKKRPVCTTGFYSLCRHPGFLWFVLLFLSLHFACGVPWADVILFILLNLGLIVFEDRAVFPSSLAGYKAYQETTPFLFPNHKSIAALIKKR